ncbi:hypothetical protein Tco_0365931 [Tanacetum coccineum]
MTQAEAEREALAISIFERYSLLKEERLVIETMAYSDKYKKILDGICLDKIKLYGINKEEEEAIIKIKGEALIEKEDPRAFVILIRLEGKINLNALADIGSDINVMPYRVYKDLGREEVHNVKKGITMLSHSKAEHMGLLSDVLCQPRQAWTLQKETVMMKKSMRFKETNLEHGYTDQNLLGRNIKQFSITLLPFLSSRDLWNCLFCRSEALMYAALHAAAAAVAMDGTTDNTGHTAADHNQGLGIATLGTPGCGASGISLPLR